jgi:hypothetical protein
LITRVRRDGRLGAGAITGLLVLVAVLGLALVNRATTDGSPAEVQPATPMPSPTGQNGLVFHLLWKAAPIRPSDLQVGYTIAGVPYGPFLASEQGVSPKKGWWYLTVPYDGNSPVIFTARDTRKGAKAGLVCLIFDPRRVPQEVAYRELPREVSCEYNTG